jgi:hypothetical protein
MNSAARGYLQNSPEELLPALCLHAIPIPVARAVAKATAKAASTPLQLGLVISSKKNSGGRPGARAMMDLQLPSFTTSTISLLVNHEFQNI